MTKELQLLASTPITLAAGGAMPTRLKLLNWGVNETGGKGTYIVNETTLAQLPANQLKANFDIVAFDFEHNTVPGTKNYKGEPCMVAGHGVPLVLHGEGLFLDKIEWTKEGTDYIGGRHYIDVSASVLTSKKGEVIFLHSAAACRQGAAVGAVITLSAEVSAKLPSSMFDPVKALKKLLGLPDTATEAELETAASAAMADLGEGSVQTLSAQIKTLKAAQPQPAAPTVPAAIADELKTLTARIDALTKTSVEKERAALLTAAAQAGKVIPDALKTADLSILSAAIDAIAPSVPMEKQTVTLKTGGVVTLSADDELVCQQLGITREQYAATAK